MFNGKLRVWLLLVIAYIAAHPLAAPGQKAKSKPQPVPAPIDFRKQAVERLEAQRKVDKALRIAAKQRAEGWAKRASTAGNAEAGKYLAVAALEYMAAEEWKSAAETWEVLVSKHAESPWTPEGRVHAFDIRLERLLDLKGAQDLLREAEAWAKMQPPGSPNPASSLAPAALPAGPTTDKGLIQPGVSVKPVDVSGGPKIESSVVPLESRKPAPPGKAVYDIHARSMLLAWLTGDTQASLKLFQQRPLQVLDPQDPTALPHPIESLGQVLMRAQQPPLLPAQGDPIALRQLRLGNLYFDVQRFGRAEELFTAVLKSPAKPSPEQRSWALWRRGHARWQQHALAVATEAHADYLDAAKAAPKAAWTAQALFLAGNIDWNVDHNGPAAVKLWSRVIKEFPEDLNVPSVLFFSGMTHQAGRRWKDAEQSFEELIRRYPKNGFVQFATRELAKVKSELQAAPATPVTPKRKP